MSALRWCCILGVTATLLLANRAIGQSRFRETPHTKLHDVGNVRRMVWHTYGGGYSDFGFCVYPQENGIEHVLGGFGKFELGTLAPSGDSLQYRYLRGCHQPVFHSTAASWDSIWVVRDRDTVDIPFWQSYEGISDQDFVCRYSNNEVAIVNGGCGPGAQNVVGLAPLYLDVIEQSFAWDFPPLNDIIVYSYRVIPKVFDLRQAYVALRFFGNIGALGYHYDPYGEPSYVPGYSDDLSSYLPDEHLGLVTDGPYGYEGQAKSRIAYKLFPPLKGPSAPLRWTFSDGGGQREPLIGAWEHTEAPPCLHTEAEHTTYMYDLVSAGTVTIGPYNRGSGYLACGPLNVQVGDMLQFWTAEILGTSLDEIRAKAIMLDTLYNHGFRTPRPPPPPHVRIETRDKTVTIRWDALSGEENPETYVDPHRGDNIASPFEGYRVYKSTGGVNGPWTLAAEYDIAGDGFAHEQGLQHSYTDAGLLNNLKYFFAVTAFSKEDTAFGFPSRESPIAATASVAVPGLPPPKRVGEVAVVPNPYRGDLPYSSYRPSWEPPTGNWTTWTELDRRVQFINLPNQCEITIYTLAGDVVRTLYHQDQPRGFHEWNLTSSIGQAVSSGLYLFTVKDQTTGEVQVGKFVIIK